MAWDHFGDKELTCQCGCGKMEMKDEFMQKLVGLRKLWGTGMVLTSAYRCPDHNNGVSSTGFDGPHTTGRAVDIRIDRAEAKKLLKLTLDTDLFTGVGIQQKGGGRFLHLDDIPGDERLWSY